MIAEALERLFAVSVAPLPTVRAQGYGLAVAGCSQTDLVRLVAVLAEGAMHGPAAARGEPRSSVASAVRRTC
jgi:hypothetical protein